MSSAYDSSIGHMVGILIFSLFYPFKNLIASFSRINYWVFYAILKLLKLAPQGMGGDLHVCGWWS